VLAGESVKLIQDTRNISNEAMKIADDNKRDSTSMVAIATLTMVFFPLSFVAILLGMPIFNWQAKKTEKIVKRSQILIYVYSALPLTLVVVFMWTYWLFYSENRRKKKKADTEATEQGTQSVNAASTIGTTEGADVSNTTGTVAYVDVAKGNGKAIETP
jgi:NADH:ubiquinone oxidoreductase subunit 5 (subunit L)/multisubunit Na+/H+ antiporter MnhA subunit